MVDKVSARWLHISDFHIKAEDSYDRDRVLKSLVDSLPLLLQRSGPVDFIIASGDIAHGGKAKEYDQATAFFDDLLAQTSLAKDKLFIIPGNHDVDRVHNSTFARTLSSSTEADNYFARGGELKHLDTKQSSYISWYNKFFDGVRRVDTTSTIQGVHSVEVGHGTIEITLVNSALFCADDNDHGKLFVGRAALEKAFGGKRPKPDTVTITVIHHPLTWLSAVESANVRSLITDYSDIVTLGHLHETDVQQSIGVTGSTLFLSAGATYQGSTWPNTASICTLVGTAVRVLPIQFVDRPRPTWTVDPSVFPEEDDFCKTYSLSRSELDGAVGGAASASASEHQILSRDALDAFEDWQSDLFRNADNDAIYVEPRLLDQAPSFMAEDAKPQQVAIDDVVASEHSYIVEGRAEYGGTNLSKRLLFELLAKGKPVTLVEAK